MFFNISKKVIKFEIQLASYNFWVSYFSHKQNNVTDNV